MGELLIERDGALLSLTLNRPERRNALSLFLMRELTAALRAAGDARVVLLAASGKVFSAGHDLSEMTGRSESEYREIFAACAELMMTIHTLPQPVIAVVQGLATAAGCQLAAACDLVVASEEAAFATPGVKIGLFCSTPMVELTRAIGRKRAMEMLLTGRTLDARTAEQWGMVNRVVPAPQLSAAARDLGRQVAQASARTVRTGKSAFHRQCDLPLEEAYESASRVMTENALSPDANEGICAFLEKRPPVWPGQ